MGGRGRSICVFCGASSGRGGVYLESARETGRAIAERGATLVYGGGGKGMMGAVADGALEAGGSVVGVIPFWMVEKEAAHPGVQEMIRVDTMLERKTRMAELSDAFLVLPGGLGSLDELFEMATWSQLDLHGRSKAIAIASVDGYYDDLERWVRRAVLDGFVPGASPGLPRFGPSAVELVETLAR